MNFCKISYCAKELWCCDAQCISKRILARQREKDENWVSTLTTVVRLFGSYSSFLLYVGFRTSLTNSCEEQQRIATASNTELNDIAY